jgi:hypothetical protein
MASYANSIWAHQAFSLVHVGLLLTILVQCAFTQSNLAADISFQFAHDAVAALWYVTLVAFLGRVISSVAWMFFAKNMQEDDNAKTVQERGTSRVLNSTLLLVLSAVVVFPSQILLGAALGPASVVYTERGIDKNMLMIYWVILLQAVWAFAELAWSHLNKVSEHTRSNKNGINKFILILMIVFLVGYLFTSAASFYDAMKLAKAKFMAGSDELKNAVQLLYAMATVQFAGTIVTFVLYAFKTIPTFDRSIAYNTLCILASAIAFEFTSILYGAVLPKVSVLDVYRHDASSMSTIPSSGSLFKPSVPTFQSIVTANFFCMFGTMLVIHLAAYSRRM